MSKTHFSQRKAAAYLGCSASTLGAYVKRGIAPRHIDFHGVRRFEVGDLDSWLAARAGGEQ